MWILVKAGFSIPDGFSHVAWQNRESVACDVDEVLSDPTQRFEGLEWICELQLCAFHLSFLFYFLLFFC